MIRTSAPFKSVPFMAGTPSNSVPSMTLFGYWPSLAGTIFLLLCFLGVSDVLTAFNPADLEKLSKTGSCPGGDLSGADLREARLSDADLSGANLAKANMSKNYVSKVNLEGANLSEANLTETSIWESNFRNACFTKADISKLELRDTDASGADFSEAVSKDRTSFRQMKLTGAKFGKASLFYVQFEKCDLSQADFSEATLKGIDFNACVLNGTMFRNAVMGTEEYQKTLFQYSNGDRVNLSGATMTGVEWFVGTMTRSRFIGAKLTECKFYHLDFRGSDFSKASIAVEIRECPFDRSDFSEAKLDGSHWKDSKFRLCRFKGATLTSPGKPEICDFRGSDFSLAPSVTPAFFESSLPPDGLFREEVEFWAARSTGDPASLTEALSFFRPLAEQGDSFSQTMLGNMLLKGFGKNDPEAAAEGLHFIELSANQNNPAGCLLMGIIRLEGDGIEKNLVEGLSWIMRAAAAPMDIEQVAMAGVSPKKYPEDNKKLPQETIDRYKLTPDQVAEATKLAATWKPTQAFFKVVNPLPNNLRGKPTFPAPWEPTGSASEAAETTTGPVVLRLNNEHKNHVASVAAPENVPPHGGISGTFTVSVVVSSINGAASTTTSSPSGSSTPTEFETRMQTLKKTDIPLEFVTNKAAQNNQLTFGEALKISLKPARDGWLTLVDINSKGDVVILFPNDFDTNNRLQSGVEKNIPSKNATYSFTMDAKETRDVVVAIIRADPAPLLPPGKLKKVGYCRQVLVPADYWEMLKTLGNSASEAATIFPITVQTVAPGKASENR